MDHVHKGGAVGAILYKKAVDGRKSYPILVILAAAISCEGRRKDIYGFSFLSQDVVSVENVAFGETALLLWVPGLEEERVVYVVVVKEQGNEAAHLILRACQEH